MGRLLPHSVGHVPRTVSWRGMRAFLHADTGAFVAGSAALIAGLLMAIWSMLGFDGQSIGVHGWVAILLGTVGTSALAIAPMAAPFASDRSGRDGCGDDGRDERQ